MSSILTDSNVIASDTNQMVLSASQDTCTVSVVGTTVVPAADMSKESQPNGWVLLFFSIAVPLFVVFLEKWVSRYYAHKDEKASRAQFRETVLDWIVKITPIEKDFSKSVHELAARIKASDDMQPEPYAVPLTLHEKMTDMSIEKMTDVFLKDFKEDRDKRYANMYNIISNFEYLSKATESVRESYESYNKQSFALCKEWNSLYETFLERCNSLKDGNPYSAVITMWFAQLMSTPNSVKTHLQALEALGALAFTEKDFDMMSLVSKMRHIAVQSQSTSTGFAIVFSNIAKNIDITLKSLSEAEQYFRG